MKNKRFMRINRYLLLCFFYLCFYKVSSQYRLQTEEIDSKLIRKIINNQFSQVVVGQDKASLNNYISYETDNSKLTLNATFPLSSNKSSINNYLTLNASGAIDDNGIFRAFTNYKLNTNTSLEFSIHSLNKNNWSISIATDTYDAYKRQKEGIESDYKHKEDSIYYKYQKMKIAFEKLQNELFQLQQERVNAQKTVDVKIYVMNRQNKLNLFEKAIISINEVFEKEEILRKKLNRTQQENAELQELQSSHEKIQKEKDSISVIIKDLCQTINDTVSKYESLFINLSETDCRKFIMKPDAVLTIDSLIMVLQKKLNKYPVKEGQLVNLERLIAENDSLKKMRIEELRESFKIEEIEVGWSSFSYAISNSKFRLFDSKEMFEKQVNSQTYVSHRLSYNYSHFKFSKLSVQHFYKFRTSVFLTDNKDELEKKEITENTKIIKDASSERLLTQKYNVYVGDYKKNIVGLNVNFDYYKVFHRESFMGMHVFPEVIAKKNYFTINSGLGFFVNFLKKDDTKSIINAEFYIKFNDLLKNQKNLFIDRHEIGIWLNIPITFKKL